MGLGTKMAWLVVERGQYYYICGKRGVLAMGESLPRRANEVADFAEDNILRPIKMARKLKRKDGGRAEWLCLVHDSRRLGHPNSQAR